MPADEVWGRRPGSERLAPVGPLPVDGPYASEVSEALSFARASIQRG